MGSMKKTHQSATHAFQVFKRHFAQPLDPDQRLVGVDKMLMFLKSIYWDERMKLGILLMALMD